MQFLLEALTNVMVVYGVAWGDRVLKNALMGSGVPSSAARAPTPALPDGRRTVHPLRVPRPGAPGGLTLPDGLEPRFRASAGVCRLRVTHRGSPGARHALATWLQDVGVEPGRGTIVGPEPWLNGAEVGAAWRR
jgi:hypothetical protein